MALPCAWQFYQWLLTNGYMTINSDKKQNMSLSLYIKNCHIIDPNNELSNIGNIWIEDGIIRAINTDTPPSGSAIEIDATDHWLTPGFIDLCHHIREPGYKHKGSIDSETKAAASAGFTQLVCPPTTMPITDSPAVAKLIQDLGAHAGYCDILPLGAMTKQLDGTQLSEMYSLKEAGCVGVTQMDLPIADTRTLLRCLEYATTFELPIHFRSQDTSLSEEGIVHDGHLASQLGLPAIPACAETIALARDLELVAHTGAQAHFGRLSSRHSVKLIRNAKQQGLPITCDVSLQHLLLNDRVIDGFNALYYELPPFRNERDRLALINGVIDGTIDAICSNHQPHDLAAKMAPIGECQPGLSILDTFVPSLLQLVAQTSMTMNTAIRALTSNPAKILQQSNDSLSIGKPANFTLINPNHEWHCTADNLLSAGQNCPQLNSQVKGKVELTIRQGIPSFIGESLKPK